MFFNRLCRCYICVGIVLMIVKRNTLMLLIWMIMYIFKK